MKAKNEEALEILQESDEAHDSAGAILVMPPDSGDFIRGNRAGYAHLAIACLLAAQGQDQSFVKEKWVVADEMDWGLNGLKFDSAVEPEQIKVKVGFWRQLIGFSLVILLAFIFVLGLVEVVHAIGNLFRR